VHQKTKQKSKSYRDKKKKKLEAAMPGLTPV
jgi:hypothetical protein